MWSVSAAGADESTADPPVIELEVLTVTATKTERSAFEVPASVSIIGPERIESEQPQSIGDLLEELPNVELLSGPRRIGETANIRGFDEERIVTTIDGARQNFNIGHQGRFFIEPDLLKHVEVYRGTNSALYGSGAIGGVIALTTKDASDFLDPGERGGARLKGGFQDVNDEWLGSVAAYGRIAKDIEYLGNVTYRASSDLLRNTTRWGDDYASQAFTYGVEYYHDRQKATRNGAPCSSFPDADDDIYGSYLEDEITLAERLSVIPGFRYNHYSLDASTRGESSESEVSPKVGLLFRTTEWLTIWGSYAEAFRAPGLTEAFAEGMHFRGIPGVFPDNFFVPNPDLKPETTSTLEAGLRTRFDDLLVECDRLRLQAAYFDIDAEDFIDLEVDIVAGTTRPDNIQDAELNGFETELGYDASRFFAAIGYSEMRGRDATTSEPLTSVPPDKLVATLGLRLPELGLVFTGRGRFVKRQDQVPAGFPVTPGYGVCDLYGSWLPAGAGYSGLRIDLGIDNLTGKSYRRHLSLIDEAGRNFKVSVSYRF
jgi:outer membrane receptor protein involved in Fe transport